MFFGSIPALVTPFAAMLVGGQCRRLAGRAARHQRVGPLVDLPLHEVTECRFIDSARRKRSHQRWYRPEKHEYFPSLELAGAFGVREIKPLVQRLIRTRDAGCPV